MSSASMIRLASVLCVSLRLAAGAAFATDSSSVIPQDVPWQKPAAASADNATYANSAGSANSAATATTAATANALCPTCTISGGQVSGTVSSAGYANSAGSASTANYANNAGYASSATALPPSCPAMNNFCGAASIGVSANGTYTTVGCDAHDTVTLLCVAGTWVSMGISSAAGSSN